MELTPDEQILQATRQSLKEEIARRKESELQLMRLHKVVVDYIYHNDSHNKFLLEAESQIRAYLKSVGIFK